MNRQLWPDSLGNHPYAKAAWTGRANWRTHEPRTIYIDENGEPDICPPLEVLGLSVPASMQWHCTSEPRPRAVTSFLPWKDSGVGIATLTVGDEAAIAVIDLAGTDVKELHRAGFERRVAAAAYAEHDILEWCPMEPLRGLPEALKEAGECRRLSARELTEAIENVRWISRTPAVFPMLGLPPRELKSLTLNVCMPV